MKIFAAGSCLSLLCAVAPVARAGEGTVYLPLPGNGVSMNNGDDRPAIPYTPNYEASMKRWIAALPEPKDAAGWVRRGDVCAAGGRYSDAQENYRKALLLDRNYAEAYVRSAAVSFKQEIEFEHRVEASGDVFSNPEYMNYFHSYLDEALKLDPKNVDALMMRGEQVLYPQGYEHALDDFNEALRLDPGNVRALLDRARAYAGLQQWDHALGSCSEAIRLEPRNADARKSRGEIYADKSDREPGDGDGDAKQAASTRDKVNAIKDYTAEIRLRLAGAEDKKKMAVGMADAVSDPEAHDGYHNDEMAVAYWSAVLEFDPKNATAWFRRAKAKEQALSDTAALPDFNKALDLDPNNVEAHEQRANILLGRDGGMHWAERDYTELVRLNPGKASRYIDRADVEDELGDKWSAISDFNTAVKLAPKDDTAYEARGQFYLNNGNWDAAIADYTRALALNEGSEMDYYWRGKAYYRRGNWDAVFADFTSNLNLQKEDTNDDLPDIGEDLDMRGVAYAHKGECDKAVAEFTRAMTVDADDIVVYDSAAWFYATSANAQFRDGTKAVNLACVACGLSDWGEAEPIDTLAAAYAESGKWKQALDFERMALKIAKEEEAENIEDEDTAISRLNFGRKRVIDGAKAVKTYTARLALYTRKQPCRDDKEPQR